MELSVISDPIATFASTQGFGMSKFLLNHHHSFTSSNALSLTDPSSEYGASSSSGVLQASAVVCPVDALAPPPVKTRNIRTAPRRLIRKTRRTKRRSLAGGGPEDGDDGFLFGDGGDYNWPFGGGSSGWGDGNGGGWNFHGFGGADDSSSNWCSDPSFDFVYELMCWIALSSCLNFAFKKVARTVTETKVR